MVALADYKSSLWLIDNIENAISALAPYFGISNNELMKLDKPRVMRVIDLAKYEDNQGLPSYSPSHNIIFFPWKPPPGAYLTRSCFSSLAIHHEVGHYLHHSVNPKIPKTYSVFSSNWGLRKRCEALNELVADYGVFVLGIYEKERWKSWEKKGWMKIYRKHKKDFLPHLARMSLEEAIKAGIVEV